jgi:hypothetical protein
MNTLDPNNEKDLSSIKKVREIHREILNFGINQKEILKLIELLSLELEDTDIMKNILSLVKPESIQEEKQNLVL